MPEIHLVFYFLGTVTSVGTLLATVWLCMIVKKGLDEHVSTIQLIYEEIRDAKPPGSS